MNLRRFIGPVAATLALGIAGASAQTYTWTGLGPDTHWTTGLNWLFGIVPAQGAGTNISFNNFLFPYTSTLDTNYTVGSVTVGALSQPFTLDNSGSSVLTLTNVFTVSSLNPVAINAPLAGTGGLQLNGSATTTLGSASNTYSGPTTISFGTLADGGPATFSPNSTVVLSGGSLAVAFNDTVGGLQGSAGAVTLASGSSLTLKTSANPSFSGTISGSGSLVVAGNGTQTLSGMNTYSGGTTVQSELFVGSSTNGPPSTFTNGPVGTGTLTFVDHSAMAPSEFSPSANVTIANPIVFSTTVGDVENDDGANYNMTLTGLISGTSGFEWCTPAILELTGANTFAGGVDMREGTLLLGSSTSGPPTAITSGPIGTGGLTLDAGSELAAALPSVTFANPINLTGNTQIGAGGSDNTALTLSGVISGTGQVTYFGGPTGTLTLSGANTYTGDTTLSGGTVIAGNSSAFGSPMTNTVNLNGGGIDVGSTATINNAINVTAPGNTVSGSGAIGTRLTVDGSITLSPGDPLGTLTFNNGLKFAANGTLTLKLYDATGSAGTGWGSFSVTAGNLVVSASMGTFALNVTTIDALGNAAPALNFNASTGYSWMLGASNNLVAFSPSDFTINTSGFQNATSGGLFSVSNVGNNLFLNFTPVPEPMTWALTALGIAVLTPFAISRRRRRRLVRA